jgi:hypothetical protein
LQTCASAADFSGAELAADDGVPEDVAQPVRARAANATVTTGIEQRIPVTLAPATSQAWGPCGQLPAEG